MEHLNNYSPFLTLIVGLLSSLGLFGFGSFSSKTFFPRLEKCWALPLGAALSVLSISLAVQFLGFFAAASIVNLSALWLVVISFGLVYLLLNENISSLRQWRFSLSPIAGCIFVSFLVSLLMAASGTTKIDELFYHMLIPQRIIQDGALLFYREPFLAAIAPQTIYQIFLTPLHALGFPHSGNIIAVGFALQLCCLAYLHIYEKTKLRSWSLLCTALLHLGMYPLIAFVTGGGHSFSSLVTMAVVLATLNFRSLLVKYSTGKALCYISILAVATVATKVSLIPLALLCISFCFFNSLRDSSVQSISLKAISLFILPWLVFYLPITLWTYLQSGSPFGSMLTSIFGTTVYEANVLQEYFQASFSINRGTFISFISHTVLLRTPLFFVAAIAALVITNGSRAKLISLFCLQAFLIAFYLPMSVRFFGGLLDALVVVFAMFAPQWCLRLWEHTKIRYAVIILLLLPWLALEIVYVWPFASFISGTVSEEQHYKKYIVAYDEFLWLDKNVPENAVILIKFGRFNNFDSPRRVYLNEKDIPKGLPVYGLINESAPTKLPVELKYFKTKELLYRNENATLVTSRIPGRAGINGTVAIYSLVPLTP